MFLLFIFSFNCLQAQFNIEHSVFFDTDKYTLSKTEKTRLQQFLAEVEKEGVIQIEIFGYCDDRGTSNYNLNLSQNRANQIKNIIQNVKQIKLSNQFEDIKNVIINGIKDIETILAKLDQIDQTISAKKNSFSVYFLFL